MSRQVKTIVESVKSQLLKKKPQLIYLLHGTDNFAISEALKIIEQHVEKIGINDFDKTVLYGSKTSPEEIIGNANAFPISSEFKFVLVKEFDEVSKPELLIPYLKQPAEFTYLVLLSYKQLKLTKKLNEVLINLNAVYEAKNLSELNLVDWLIHFAEEKGKRISSPEATLLVDLIGENRDLLMMQMEKMINFIGEKEEITFEDVKKHAIDTKEYNIFDFIDAIGEKDKEKAFVYAFNILKHQDVFYLLAMLNKFFMQMARIEEVRKDDVGFPTRDAKGRAIGVPGYFFEKYLKARQRYSENQLIIISKALLDADLSLKTSTSLDEKTVITVLLSKIFSE